MDVLATDILRSASLPGSPGDPVASAARRYRVLRAQLEARLRRLQGSGSGQGTGAERAAVRRRALLAYTAATIVVGVGLLAWTSLVMPPLAGIDPRIGTGTVLEGPTGGLLLWLVYGLLGSLRVLRAPSGTTMTFHMPFLGAAMILGGPTAGAWVAFLSSIERRELESQPWYGMLANHSALAIGAVLGGVTTQAVGALLGAEGTGTAALAAALAGTLVLATVSIALGVGTVLLRDDISPRAFLELLLGQIGRITALECALVIVLATAYAELGWWSPLLVGGFVLLVWDNDPMPAPDALTGLLTPKGFERRLDAGLGRLRRGAIPGAALMSIDLDRFKAVNDRYGHAVGNEVLREVGVRLLAQARRPSDLAGRLGGDELALFLPGLLDDDTAMRRAADVVGAISAPIATSVGTVRVGASVGVLVVRAWGGVPSGDALRRDADRAMYHAKRAGGGVHRYDPEETAELETSASEASA